MCKKILNAALITALISSTAFAGDDYDPDTNLDSHGVYTQTLDSATMAKKESAVTSKSATRKKLRTHHYSKEDNLCKSEECQETINLLEK